jgi:hypothetical protein
LASGFWNGADATALAWVGHVIEIEGHRGGRRAVPCPPAAGGRAKRVRKNGLKPHERASTFFI